MEIVLVAEESAGIKALQAVAATDHRIRAVMTTPRNPSGSATVAAVAERLALPVWPASLVGDPALAERLRREGVDVLLNVHSLFIARPEVVSAPRIGSFNLHPGPLPEYAGLNAPSWAIYRGEDVHGVTLHWMTDGIDTGAIAYQQAFAIERRDTALTVTAKCVRHGIPLITRLLEAAADDPSSIPAVAQDLTRRRYHGKEVPDDGWLVWSDPAKQVTDFVRASDYLPFHSPWGHPRASIEGRTFGVVKATLTGRGASAPHGTVGSADEGAVLIATGDEWVAVRRVIAEGQYLDAVEFLDDTRRLDDPRIELLYRPARG